MIDWIVFFTVFGLLFLGELGDKTQLIVFNLSLEHEKSYKVAIGAMLGFAVIVSLGVFLGAIITTYVPISLIQVISGVVFILIGVFEMRDLKEVYRQRKREGEEGVKEEKEVKQENLNQPVSKLANLRNNPYAAGFGFIFVMELGDKSQILTITLASIYPSPLEVWLASFLALSSLALMGAYFGEFISRKIPKLHLKVLSIAIFVIIGIIVIVTSV